MRATLGYERRDERLHRGWLRSLLEKLGDKPHLIIVEAPDARTRAELIAYRGKITFAELLHQGRFLRGSEAVKTLEQLEGEARIAVARLRETIVDWGPQLELGIKGIDLQHRQLVNTLNRLYQGLLLGEPGPLLRGALSFLEEYSRLHFRSEERFFERHGYPRAEEHRRQHRWFIEKVRELREREALGETTLTLEVIDFLAEWVARHIAGSDRDYAEWIRRLGGQP
ncbi:MAG: hemerythrin family protein [Crenarchaeota archaeon]|nr:hemerythrin family protein [Thermoproteota archaeon]